MTLIKKGSSLTAAEKKLVFEEMDEVTREVAEAGKKKLKTGYQVALLIQYDLGALINRVYEAEHLNDAQKNTEIQRLAAYWDQPGLNPTTLCDLRNVAAAFTREFISAQAEEPLADGTYLTWSHFKELQKISNPKRQLALLKEVRKRGWSAKELALELRGGKEAAVARSGGRLPSLPKTPRAFLQKLFTTIQTTDNLLVAAESSMVGLLTDISPEEVDEQFVERLAANEEKAKTAALHLKDAAKRLAAARKRAEKVLAAKPEAPSESAVEQVETVSTGKTVKKATAKKATAKKVVKKKTPRKKTPGKKTAKKKTARKKAVAAASS